MSSNQTAKVQQVQALRRSGAAGKHADRRTRRARTRSASRRRAIAQES